MIASSTPRSDREPRQAWLTAAKFYLLAAATHAALIPVSELPVVHRPFLRLGWRLGPWPDFPFPYNFDFAAAGSFPWSIFLPVAVTSVLGLTLAVAAVHGFVFLIVVLLHAWLGWPRYWQDVRSAVKLRFAWATSARRSWWIWPAAQIVWLLWDQLAVGFVFAFYPIINTRFPFLTANLAAVALGYAYVSSGVVREHVVRVIGPDQLRCPGCGYLLRGLESHRCPECGHEISRNVRPIFCFKWQRFGRWKLTSRLTGLILLLMLLAAPLAVPMILVNLPRSWLQSAPSVIVPWQVLTPPNPDAFPIRLDAVCVIRHEGALAVIRFSQELPRRGRYEVGFWPDADAFGREPPESTHAGKITSGGGPDLPVGPWPFRYGLVGENMVWLFRPDGTYHVEAFRIECFSGDLSWLEKRSEDTP